MKGQKRTRRKRGMKERERDKGRERETEGWGSEERGRRKRFSKVENVYSRVESRRGTFHKTTMFTVKPSPWKLQ